MESLVFQLLIFAVLFSVGLGFGRYNERKHLAELEQNEKRLAYITVGNLRKVSFEQSGHMISSNVVISHDYFKYVLAPVRTVSRMAARSMACRKASFLLASPVTSMV